MDRILLTGGAGYIGSHTAFALAQAGYEPIVLDNLSHGHREAVKWGPFVEGDLGDEALVCQVCATYAPKAIIHFGAFIEVGESVRFPEKYMENNTVKAARLFDAAEKGGIRHVVFSSTAAVYGMPTHQGLLTEDDPLIPINPYGESKLAAEKALRGHSKITSMALRYFNAAGAAPEAGIGEAHEPETHLIPNVILAGLGKKPGLTLFGSDYPTKDGTAVRDYIHVLDLAAAHIAALDYLLKGGATSVCNLGSGVGYSVREVVETVERALGVPVPKTMADRREGDPARLVADSSRAKSLLGWEPKYGLEAIVSSALAWHRGAGFPT